MISHLRMLLLLLLAALPAQAQGPGAIAVLERRTLALEPPAGSHRFQLALAYLDGSGWTPEPIVAAVRESARILMQCDVTLENAELLRIGAPDLFRDFSTPTARALARALPLGKPAVYFVAGTRQRPAFEAEAVGRGNSGSRPELQDTVWITRGTRDIGIVLAHELVHVLMDSGAHSDEPGNLMREETAPGNTLFSEAQCVRLRATGAANGLLAPR
jgi:hypothetical protein